MSYMCQFVARVQICTIETMKLYVIRIKCDHYVHNLSATSMVHINCTVYRQIKSSIHNNQYHTMQIVRWSHIYQTHKSNNKIIHDKSTHIFTIANKTHPRHSPLSSMLMSTCSEVSDNLRHGVTAMADMFVRRRGTVRINGRNNDMIYNENPHGLIITST